MAIINKDKMTSNDLQNTAKKTQVRGKVFAINEL